MYGMRAILLFGLVVTAAVSSAQDFATSKIVDEALQPIRSQIQGPLTRVKWAGSLYKNGETYTGQWLKRPPMNPTDYVCAQLANAIPLEEYDAIPLGEVVAFTTEKSRIAKTIPGGQQIVKWARQMGPWMAAEREKKSHGFLGQHEFGSVEAISVRVRRQSVGYSFFFNAQLRGGSIDSLGHQTIMEVRLVRGVGVHDLMGNMIRTKDGECFAPASLDLWTAITPGLWRNLLNGKVTIGSLETDERRKLNSGLALSPTLREDWLLSHPNGLPEGTLLWIEKETEPWILLSGDAPDLLSPRHWNTNPEAGISYYAPAYKEPVAPVWMTLYQLHIQPPGRARVTYNFQGFRLAEKGLSGWRDLPDEWRTAMEQAISHPYTGPKRPHFYSYHEICRVLLKQLNGPEP